MSKRLLATVTNVILLTALVACELTLPTVIEEPVDYAPASPTVVEEPVDPTPAASTPTELPSESLPQDLDALDRALFVKLRILYQTFAASSDDIWDGLYRPDKWPLLFVRLDTRRKPQYGYLINAPSLPSDAEPLSSNPDGLPPVHRITKGIAPFADPDLYFDTFYSLGDLTLLAFRYQEEEDDTRDPQWLPYVVHEGFHRFQEETWQEPQEWDQEVNYPLTAENLALALLEQQILLAGLDVPGDQARDLLRTFAAVRAERMARYPAVRSLDNPQEWSEGTTGYVERRFTAAAGIDDATSLRQNLTEPLDIEADLVRDTFTWDRFYATGDTVCLLMDRAGIAWRPDAAQGRTLYDVLSAALALSDAERADLLAQAQDRFDYPSLLARAQRWVKK